jgi:hypothetical protein
MIEIFEKATVKSNNPNKTRAVRLRADITSTNIGDIAPTTVVEADKKFVAERDGEFGLGSLAGDIWWHVPEAKVKQDNTPRDGWMAQRHKGEELLIVTLSEPEDPEDPPGNQTPIPVDADVHLTIRAGVIVGVTVDGETWQKTDSFG